MKHLLLLLLFPLLSFSQTYKDVMSIKSENTFKKVVIENGYEFDNDFDADWIFQIEGSITANGYGMGMVVGGGFSGKILDFSDNSKVIATFSTKEKMNFTSGMDDGLKRSTKFKNFQDFILAIILRMR